MSEILVPLRVQPYVDVLGIEGAFDFMMAFGGADVYFALNPGEDSRLVEAIGHDKAAALARRLNAVKEVQRVPLAKPFLARVLQTRDIPIAEIARRLHVSNVAVRSMLSDDRQKREAEKLASASLQLSFFDDN